MKRLIGSMMMVACVLALAAGSHALADECCDKAKASNGWDASCNDGYFYGVVIPKQKLHSTLVGHNVDEAKLESMGCASCKEAFEKDTVCVECHVWFNDGKAYQTVIAYQLSKGTPKAADEITCAGCQKLAGDHGWCTPCNVGFVHGMAFESKKDYESALKAYEALEKAAKMASKCESCSIAFVKDGTCEACQVSFKDGKMLKM